MEETVLESMENHSEVTHLGQDRAGSQTLGFLKNMFYVTAKMVFLYGLVQIKWCKIKT